MVKQKELENLTGCIIASKVLLHYNEQIKHTPHYKQKLKKSGNEMLKELIKVEETIYAQIENDCGDSINQLSENYFEFIEMITKGSFSEFMSNQILMAAAVYDRKRMIGIAEKILNEKQK